MNMDHISPQMPKVDQTEATTRRSDPMETVLEAVARLRVLERLLQHALAAKTTTERRSLVLRYNRQRRELRERLEVSLAGPLRQDSSDQILNAAIGSIRGLLDQLVIS